MKVQLFRLETYVVQLYEKLNQRWGFFSDGIFFSDVFQYVFAEAVLSGVFQYVAGF